MNPLATTSTTSPAFTLDPTLPWLRQDPTMQRPESFAGVRLLTLGAATYAPMGQHYPGGTTLALRTVSRPDELTEGVYWLERTHHQTNGVPPYTMYSFGRYAGLTTTSDERTRARRLKQGKVHFELEADVLVPDLRSRYCLREDGTETCYVDFTDANFRLWRVSHYVSLAPNVLAQLPAEATAQTGPTAQQQRWLDEEQLIQQGKAEEYRVHVLGSLPDNDLRVVLAGEQIAILNYQFEHATPLTPGQAKRCKAVAVTSRSYYTGRQFRSTERYRLRDVTVLLDWFTSLARLQRTEEAARELAARNKSAWQQHLDRVHAQALQALGQPELVAAEAPLEELALAA